MAYEYIITQNDKGEIIVNLYKDDELILSQHVNPETGEPFKSEDEAKEWVKKVIMEYELGELTENPPHLRVRFLNPETGNIVKVAKVGEPVKVDVELYYPTDDPANPMIYIPVTGDYIVPYYTDETQAGSVIIHIEGGKGSGIVRFNKSGIFTIKLDKVLNAQTMRQPEPLPILEENPIIAVVEEMQSNTTQ